jgi:hypothetical protein
MVSGDPKLALFCILGGDSQLSPFMTRNRYSCITILPSPEAEPGAFAIVRWRGAESGNETFQTSPSGTVTGLSAYPHILS